MKDKIRALIKGSQVITNSKKAIYSKLLDFINEEKQKEILKILENEVFQISNLDNEAISEKLQLNKTFIDQVDDFFKNEEKKAIQFEEKDEQNESTNILNQLNEA